MKLFPKQSFLLKWISCYRDPANDDHPSCAAAKRHAVPFVETTTTKKKKKNSVHRFNPEEIDKSMATSTVIGEGGFSTVYLAHLPCGSGTSSAAADAAFKVHHSGSCSERLHRAFLRELDILLHVRHPNIVPLLGYCTDGEEGVLVFEYISNGTLHDHLHVDVGCEPSRGGGGVLISWPTRMSIAFQLATALDYLHEGCDLQIIHGDVKASNMLLDSENNLRLCDFGSARMGFSAAVETSSSRKYSAMVGSPGYVDPHYLRTGMITKKSDVYSFGVLLLELITGLEAFCSVKEQLLASVVRLQPPGSKLQVDPRLGGEYNVEEASAMTDVALRCINVEQPALRPSMSEVIRIMRETICNMVVA